MRPRAGAFARTHLGPSLRLVMRPSTSVLLVLVLLAPAVVGAQQPAGGRATAPARPAAEQPATPLVAPAAFDPRLYDIVAAPSAARLEADVRRLVAFGTRHTYSDTTSSTTGIGAARRWIKSEFDRISAACGGCLEVSFHANLDTVPTGVHNVVNVVAVQRGTARPERYVVMSGHFDSRVNAGLDDSSAAPGANDDGSGTVATIEAARILSRYRFPATIVYTTVAGEEQGLTGARFLAEQAKREGWNIVGVLNNDIIGNSAGITGAVGNTTFRVFSEPVPAASTQSDWNRFRLYGGEVDGPSRQLARYVDRIAETYLPTLDAKMIYRLDRFGRGGDHRAFNDNGFAAVRLTETYEHFDRQHQNVRTEDGRAYGDLPEGMDFGYLAKMTAVNAATLAALAAAPPAPTDVRIGGGGGTGTTLSWTPVPDPALAGYRIYWRETTSPQWERSRFVGPVERFTLPGVIIDNYLFGVAAVGRDGNESPVVFAGQLLRRQ